MTCTEFLERYSDFRDGRLSPADALALHAHRASCASCARYDDVVRRGVELVRRLEVPAAPDFHRRLRLRLRAAQRSAPSIVAPTRARPLIAALALIAMAGAAVQWAQRMPASAPPAAHAAHEHETDGAALAAPGVLVTRSAGRLELVQLPTERPTSRTALAAPPPAGYSPLVLAPPTYRGGYTSFVSTAP